MTRLELENLVADWLNDPNKTYHTAAKIQTRLQNALQVLQFLLIDAYQDFYTKCASTALVANQERYKVPSDFLKVRLLEVHMSGSGDTADKQPITPMDLTQKPLAGRSGEPTHYFLTKNHIHLRPIPTTVRALEMNYIYRVGEMLTDNSEPDAPEEYHEFLAILASEDGMIKDGADIAALLRKKDEYEKRIGIMAANRKPDGARMITATRDGYGGL